MKGFSVYMTEKEYKAIKQCIESFSQPLESACEEYVALIMPTLAIATKFEKKCVWAYWKANN